MLSWGASGAHPGIDAIDTYHRVSEAGQPVCPTAQHYCMVHERCEQVFNFLSILSVWCFDFYKFDVGLTCHLLISLSLIVMPCLALQ